MIDRENYEQHAKAARLLSGFSWLTLFLTMVCQFVPILVIFFVFSENGTDTFKIILTIGYILAVAVQGLALVYRAQSYKESRLLNPPVADAKKLYLTEWAQLGLILIPTGLLIYIVHMAG